MIAPEFKRLLEFDAKAMVHKLGLASEPEPIPDSLAASLLNLAEGYSRAGDAESKDRCVTICALLWEHRRPEWLALQPFVAMLLARLGLGPSIAMVAGGEGGSLASPGSWALSLTVAGHLARREATLGDERLQLSDFQHELWKALEHSPRVGVSAPTSAGKSFILVRHIARLLLQGPAQIIYIVPTLSLIRQVSRDLRSVAAQYRIDVDVVNGTLVDDNDRRDRSVLYVLTQERAFGALQDQAAFVGSSLVVIDEVQNIERASDPGGERARLLLDVIEEFQVRRRPKQLVIAGPRLENISELTTRLLGKSAVVVDASIPPVVNITYALVQSARGPALRQYTTVSATPVTVRAGSGVPGWQEMQGKQHYKSDAYRAIGHVVERLHRDGGTVVFSPTSDQATRTALEVSALVPLGRQSLSVEDLSEYIAQSVHPNYALSSALRGGVGYHHGKMPQHARVAVEIAFSTSELKVLVCTTTLMQGVNMPAKNIVARNPHLFIRRSAASTELTTYEFANLRGRAGRLMQDFVGRAIVMDEPMFKQSQVGFDFPGADVPTGFHERFQNQRAELRAQLFDSEQNVAPDAEPEMVAYIRYTILRHREAAVVRLRRVGIDLSTNDVDKVLAIIDRRSVPRNICVALPYWDPLEVDNLYRAFTQRRVANLPHSGFSRDFVDTLSEVVHQIAKYAPYQAARVLKNLSEANVQALAISAQGWSTEKPLAEIIDWGERPDSNEVDRRLLRVLKSVAFDLPRLLRPIALFMGGEPSALPAIESGASKSLTRTLIGSGLPREVAIAVSRHDRRQNTEFGDGSLGGHRDAIRIALSAAPTLLRWPRRIVQDLYRP